MRGDRPNIGAFSFGLTVSLQDDLVLHYLLDLTNDEQKQRWLPGFASGELIGALAMTEPGAGSDLGGNCTTARRDGDHWVLNGQKTFISSGIMADVVVVAAFYGPSERLAWVQLVRRRTRYSWFRSGGVSWRRSGCRPKTPPNCSSTMPAVPPAANLLGEEGMGLVVLDGVTCPASGLA